MANPKYESIENGQQLIEAGIIPKTSSEHLALILALRADALRDKALASLNDDMLGYWKPVDPTQFGKDIVVDANLGHRVRLTKAYQGQEPDNFRESFQLPAGFTGILKQYQPQRGSLIIKTDGPVPGVHANKRDFGFPLATIISTLEVSSLGQETPQDKEELVAEYVMKNIFPKTILDYDLTRRIFTSLEIMRDGIYDGPPGSAKSTLVKDIIAIAKQQGYIFTTGCKFNCNPFSVFDENFSRVVPPCPECMIKFDTEKDTTKNFKDTGIFHRPKAKDVSVVVAKYDYGHGIERATGSIKLTGEDLVGYKLPRLDGTTTDAIEDNASPEGFKPGKLARANNGIFFFDEMDKPHSSTLDVMLEPLEENTLSSDQLRYQLPAHSLILGTANNNEVFEPWINDRMMLLHIPYTEDVDVAREITKRAYHKLITPLDEVPLPDTHKMDPINLRDVPMPIILENAVNAWYIKFRKEFPPTNPNWQQIFGGERCKKDALDYSRGLLATDRRLGLTKIPGTNLPMPQIVTQEYAMEGIEFALKALIQNKDPKVRGETRTALNDFVRKHYPEVLEGERNKWWCDVVKQIAVRGSALPEIMENYVAELEIYKTDPDKVPEAFDKVKQARTSTAARVQMATVKLPFMDLLFDQQPHITKITTPQLQELMAYFMKSGEGISCPTNP